MNAVLDEFENVPGLHDVHVSVASSECANTVHVVHVWHVDPIVATKGRDAVMRVLERRGVHVTVQH